MGVLIWTTALYHATWKKDIWKCLFTEIALLEDVTNLNTNKNVETNIFKSATFQLILTILIIGGLFAYEPSRMGHNNQKVFLYTTTYIYFFLHFLLSVIIGNVAVILKLKFQDINNYFLAFEYENSTALIKGTKKVKDLYASMVDIVETFNKLFGPQLFLMGLHCSSQILQWSLTLVYNMFSDDDNDDYDRLIIGVIYIVLMLIWLGVTMFCCDLAVVESEEIVAICYRLQMAHPVFSEPYQNIKNLLYLVRTSKIRFTAMDYYEISRSTMFDLIGTTATYFVVLIQFYDSKK
ncbi:hypothetical protein GWI33_016716 [Rhynchophorus ferrugineus]|uniref:Gustatory receptor n=1 Tax=Rhynchophorus ferrugineus TaxID=354439 RepID=A0A834M8D7_RHYFE|nr:hypothetical protein GWI33_016716 [Rhynchophorus ferrugineus]